MLVQLVLSEDLYLQMAIASVKENLFLKYWFVPSNLARFLQIFCIYNHIPKQCNFISCLTMLARSSSILNRNDSILPCLTADFRNQNFNTLISLATFYTYCKKFSFITNLL